MIFPNLFYIIIPLIFFVLQGIIMRKSKINFNDFIGKKINKWTIISYFITEKSGLKRTCFLCICECQKSSIIVAYKIINGSNKSCVSCGAKRHGYYGTPEYRSWSGARSRCYNPNVYNYEYYGGRGIRMHERWDKFENFLSDMGLKPKSDKPLSLDRINNDGNYEPGNCRWATQSQQNSNQTKRFSKKLITEGNLT